MKKFYFLSAIVLFFFFVEALKRGGWGPRFYGLKGERVRFFDTERDCWVGDEGIYFLVETSNLKATLRTADGHRDKWYDIKMYHSNIRFMLKHDQQLKMPRFNETGQSWRKRNGFE